MKNSLKTVFKLFSVVFLATLVFTSCSKDDDPVDNDLFIGKYKGKISYVEGDTHISKDDGSVEVVKVGKNYNFLFSDKIPNLTGVTFEKEGENVVINVGSDEAHLIRIDQSKLVIAYTKDGKVWTANCDR